MKKEWKFIAFDLGAENGRCFVAILQDQKIILNEVHRFITHSLKIGNGFHWDVLAIFEEILEGLSKAKKALGPDFDGVAVDTWGVDYVLIDPDGRIIGYPYHYRDDRTDEIMEETFKILPKETLYSKVGIQFAQYNTLFQLLSEKKRKLNLLNIADKILMMPDFMNFMLSGEKKAEYSIASTTNLADPKTRNWSWELINSFGLPKNIFPEMIEPGTRLGTLQKWIADRTGLNSGVPIFAIAGHDTASAVVSIPASEENRAFLSSGTWSVMGIELEKPLLTFGAMKYNFTNEGGVNGTTRFLKNLIGLWPIQECRRYWKGRGNDYSYKQLADLAKAEGCVKAWIDLTDARFLKPGEMPEKIMAYLKETNQTVKTNIGFIIGVIIESLAFSCRKTLKEIEEVTCKEINKLHTVGGGIQNEVLTQYIADAIGRTVLAGPVEGTIVGNIGVQAIASGAVPNLQTWRNIVSNSFDLKEYHPVNAGYFIDNGKNYERILRAGEIN